MRRRVFLGLLLVPLLVGCGGGGNSGSDVGAAVFRGAAPLTHSLSLDGSAYEVLVTFDRLRATFRSGVVILLRNRTNPGLVLSSATVGSQVAIRDEDQYTVATLDNPPVGEYYLEATDVNGASIVNDAAGDRLLVRIVE